MPDVLLPWNRVYYHNGKEYALIALLHCHDLIGE